MDNSLVEPKKIVATGGEMGELIHTFDWSVTPLGNPEGWSLGLKIAVTNMLRSSYPACIWWDHNLIMLYNDAYLSILGEKHPAALGQSARLVWSGIWEQFSPLVDKVFAGHPILKPHLYQFTHSKNASETPWTFSYNPVFEEDGSVGGVLLTGYESVESAVSGKKPEEKEDQLRQSEERYRAFVSQSSEAIWRFELEKPLDITLPTDEFIKHCYQYGYLAECNDAMAKMYGFTKAAELVGIRLGDVLPASDPANIAYISAFIESGFRLTEAESHEIDRHGQPRYFLNNLTGIIENGLLLRAWGTQRDITGRKHAEQNNQFLMAISEDLASLSNAAEMMQIVGEKLGKYLNATRCVFVEYDLPKQLATISYNWCQAGQKSMVGIYQLSNFISDDTLKLLALGKQLIVGNIKKDSRIVAQYQTYAAFNIGAAVSSPYVSNGICKYALTVHYPEAQAWQTIELNLLQEVSNRVWNRIERARAEEALRNSENQLRLVTDAMPALISYVDTEHRYRFINKAYTNWFGHQPEDILGKYNREVLGENAYQAILSSMEKALSGEELTFERLLPYKDAGERFVHVNYVPDIQPDGSVKGYYSLVQDVTERKQVEEALRESEERLRRAVGFAKIVVWEWDVLTNRITTTENFAEVYGLSSIEQDQQGFALVHPEDRARHMETVQRIAQEGGSYISEFRIIRPDTKDIGWIEERATAILDDKGQVVQVVGAAMDITNRKVAEAARQESEERYHNLFNSIDEGFCVCEMLFDEAGNPADYRFLEINPMYAKLTGLSHAVGKTGRELEPNLEETWFKIYGQVVITGEPVRFESHLAAWNKWYDLYVSRIGKPEERKFAILFKDITERKRSEISLRESEERLRHLADAMPQVVWIADATGTVNYYNNRVKELSGVVQTAPDQWEWQPVLHPDDVAPTLLAWQKAVQEKTTYAYEHRIRMKDGSYRWHLSRAFPTLDTDGDLIRWYGTATDIDDLKQTQQALVESEQHFRKLADAAPVLIWQAGLDKACYYFNKGWLAFTGRTLEEEQGNGWAEGVHPEDIDQCLDIYTGSFDRHEPFMMEYRLRRHDGAYRWLLDHGTPTYDHNGVFTGFVGTCIDIHEKKTTQEQKDAFLHIAGHELRTPLTSMLGFINLMLKQPGNTDFAKDYLQKSLTSALKMRRLISDFLYFAKSNPVQLSYEISEFNFDKLIQETIENTRLSHPQYQIMLQGNTQTMVKGDRERIEQVVSNLLNNAIKYAPGKYQIDVLLKQEGDKVILAVKDYGIGIEPEEIPLLFKRFHRAGNTGRIRGMGLGLYIVKEIVDFHQGNITVKSKPGEGATFTIELPLGV